MEPRSRRYSRRVCHKRGGGSGGGGGGGGGGGAANTAKGQLVTPIKVNAIGSAVEITQEYRAPNAQEGSSNTKVSVAGAIDGGKAFTIGSFGGISSVPDAEAGKVYKPMIKAALAAAKKSGATQAEIPVNYVPPKVAEVVKKASSGTESRYGQEYYKFKL